MADKKQIDSIRRVIHDLRANHHGANLNAQAAGLLSKKIDTPAGEKVAKHLNFLIGDLEKFKVNLNELSDLIKSVQ
ncbi:MAG: hypothetical protein DWQ05_14745 [Calditrichaeota bacterium]|nr:MAG: hypothetical protein DWQ05_14745 [Calditrichota bacterium]